MKEITKQRLKQINRLLKIGLLTFCWLMACVGITAYSVYWLRQNANYEQEVNSRVLKPKKANVNLNDNYYVGFSNYEASYYNSLPNYDAYFTRPSNILNDFTVDYIGRIKVIGVDNLVLTKFSLYFSFTGEQTPILRYIYQFRYSDADEFVYQNTLLRYVNNSEGLYSVDPITEFFGYFTRYETTYDSFVVDYVGLFKEVFNVFYSADNATDFDFNNMLNYNRLFSYQLDNYNVFKYNGNTATTAQNITYYCNLTFMSNGVLFDKVEFNCSCVAYVSDNNGNTQLYSGYLGANTTDFYLTLTSISYRYYGTNRSLVVSSLGVLDYKTQYNSQTIGSTPVWLTLNGFNWINENYKYLSIYNGSLDNPTESSLGNMLTGSSVPFLNLTSYQALSFDYANNINSITDIGLSNVFTMMSNAFTGLASLMAINVIPGITLGLLAFVPFIVGIILIVIRLVKK